MSSSFGHDFRITTFGESHSNALGVIMDGVPAGIEICWKRVQKQLARRRPGQSAVSSPRQEQDQLRVLSGMKGGCTLGTPLALMVENHDQKPQDYQESQNLYRPSHGDYTYHQKYGMPPPSGGGRSSARETVARVAAGAVAEQCLMHDLPDWKIVAYVTRIAHLQCPHVPLGTLSREDVDGSVVRCGAPQSAKEMEDLITTTRQQQDSVGGEIRCEIHGIPPGLGEPVFDKLEADLAKAMMSLPAARYISMGEGYLSTTLTGSQNNDHLTSSSSQSSHSHTGTLRHRSNRCGGIEGGISNGAPIYFSVGFKPPSSILKPQPTVDHQQRNVTFTPTRGRHDPCVLPRAVPIVEAMACCVILDHLLQQRKHQPSPPASSP